MAVEQILERHRISYQDVRLGEVITGKDLTGDEIKSLREDLEKVGFELLDNEQQQVIEKIKAIIIQNIHYSGDKKFNLSHILSTELSRDYSSLSKLFSTTEGMTIEQFVILQKTERVKELLSYNQQNLNEIAFEMGYSSVAHLSAQFKKITGMTPTQFKSQGIRLRHGLDNVK